MDDTEAEKLLTEVFFGYSARRLKQAETEHREFVHYTSAAAALSIIENKEIWLRNAGVMNDYAEIAHGEACIRHCLLHDEITVQRSRKVLDNLVEGLHDHAIQYLENSSSMRRTFTYLLSVSEHGPEKLVPGTVDSESQLGRLSMWRAYGSSGGVALIFHGHALWEPRGLIPVYVNPVFYGDQGDFARQYHDVLSAIENNLEALRQISPDDIKANFERCLHFASLSTKHPGFVDEREWRLTYSADPANEQMSDEEFNSTNVLQRQFITVNGLPQRIYKVPFKDFGEHGSTALPEVLRQAIVGPSQFPMVLADALNVALLRAGMPVEKPRLQISHIPIRT